jgi:hypothetical protein
MEQHSRTVSGPAFQRLGDCGFAAGATAERDLVLRLVAEREKQAADMRMSVARSLLTVALPALVLARGRWRPPCRVRSRAPPQPSPRAPLDS